MLFFYEEIIFNTLALLYIILSIAVLCTQHVTAYCEDGHSLNMNNNVIFFSQNYYNIQ